MPATSTAQVRMIASRVLEYCTTVQGILSLLPTTLTLLDSVIGWLPISSVIKPWVYILIVLLTAFGIWVEVGRIEGVSMNAIQRKVMRRRAYVHMIAAVILIGAYWVLGEQMNVFTPALVAFRTATLFLLALLVGLVFSEISRAFAILALLTIQTS